MDLFQGNFIQSSLSQMTQSIGGWGWTTHDGSMDPMIYKSNTYPTKVAFLDLVQSHHRSTRNSPPTRGFHLQDPTFQLLKVRGGFGPLDGWDLPMP